MCNNYIIATLASHSCLQILKGAKDEGFQTLAFSLAKNVSFYKRFPFIDEVVSLESYSEIFKYGSKRNGREIILIPHGSFSAYLGSGYGEKLKISHFGLKKTLDWEIDRNRQMQWLKAAEIKIPKIFKNSDIDRQVIVKLDGARGGSGYFLAGHKKELETKLKNVKEKYLLQEFIIGTPVYLQYFYSKMDKRIELLGIDRRYESNIDGLCRMAGQDFVKSMNPTFTIIGNSPLVIRESLLPQIYEMGERVVTLSKKLIDNRGLYGPFCLETVVTEDQKFYCIEISCRIVAGTNLYIDGSPYTRLLYDMPISCGRRIAMEIKKAITLGRLDEIID